MNRQAGFTLLELVLALAIFALLGLAGARLFDSVVRAQQGTASHEQQLRRLQRAIGVIERDALQAASSVLVLGPAHVQLLRGNWRNPQDFARSERQQVLYRLDKQVLWRESRSLDASTVERQPLLDDVRLLKWRVFARDSGWSSVWPVGKDAARNPPLALEVVLSFARFEQVRRVLPLPQGPP